MIIFRLNLPWNGHTTITIYYMSMANYIESFCKDSTELRCPKCAAQGRTSVGLCKDVCNISPRKAIYLHMKLLPTFAASLPADASKYLRVILPEEIKSLVTATPELNSKSLSIEIKRIGGGKGVPPIKTASPLYVYIGDTPIYVSCQIKTIEAEADDEKTPAMLVPTVANGAPPLFAGVGGTAPLVAPPATAPAPTKKKAATADMDAKLDLIIAQQQQILALLQAR